MSDLAQNRTSADSEAAISLTAAVKELGAELDPVFDALDVALYLIDTSGIVRWQNPASIAISGDKRGTRVWSGIAPEYRRRAEQSFARQFLGAEGSVVVDSAALGNDGRRIPVRVRRVPIESDDGVVGVLGIVRVLSSEPSPAVRVHLSPRQHETLRLLANGLSTNAIAAELGVARETARNYIRQLLQRLGVHSRLEAVVRGRELELV
jgi:PAS domain S-box-containing protein